MDEKEIWKNLQKIYGKDKLDGDETFGPMLPPDFDFKKHYIPLMENYKAALRKIDELESELDKFCNGYQGGCYACEIVGEKNVALEAENQRLSERYEALRDNVTTAHLSANLGVCLGPIPEGMSVQTRMEHLIDIACCHEGEE